MRRDTRRIQGLGISVVVQVRNHVIFLAKTTKYHPNPCPDGLGRNPNVPVTQPFTG